MNDQAWKAKMFGTIDTTKRREPYRPNLEELLRPKDYNWDNRYYDPATGLLMPKEPEFSVVVQQFCTGCGSLYGIIEEDANIFAEKCQDEEIDFEKGFFQTSGCPCCDGNEEEPEFILFDSLKS